MLSIAYLMNRYPQGNQSFVWREIAALERLGARVDRFTIRHWDEPLVDATALAERGKTRAVLDVGLSGLLLAAARTALASPRRFGAGLWTALRLGRRSEQGLAYHVVYLAEACVLLRWLRGCGARHLHVHFGTNSAMVALLCRSLGGPTYSFTCHGPTEFDRPVYLSLGEKIRRAAFVVAVGSFGRSQLFRWCGHEQWPKIRIVRCGVDDVYLADAWAGPSVENRRFVCVGRLVEQKGHLLLVQAAVRLAAEGVGFELTFIGHGPMRAPLQELIDGHGLSECVTIAGWLSNDDVREAMRRSRATILPSFAEGLPVVLMESLAMGRAAIATSVGAIPELVETGVTGWLVPPGSVDALACAMRDALAAEVGQLERMGAAGRSRVRERHDASREAAKLLALIEGVVNGADAQAAAMFAAGGDP